MDDTPPYRTDGGHRDEGSSDDDYVHEPAVDHETWESVTGGDIEEVREDPETERDAGDRRERSTPRDAGARGGRDPQRDARRDAGERRDRSAPDRGDAARQPTDRRTDAGRGRGAGSRPGDRSDAGRGRQPERRGGRSGEPGRGRSDPDARQSGQRRGTAEWAGAAPDESGAPADGDEPRSPDWDAARGRDTEDEAPAEPVAVRDPGSVVDAVSTAVVAHVAVGLGVAATVVLLGIVSRPMFGRRDAIDPVYLVEGEVLIHALPALALALAAGTGLYVAGRRRAGGDLADAGLGGIARAVVPAAAVAAGGGSLALAVLVVGSGALLLDPFLSFQPLNFVVATVVLVVVAAAVAGLAAVGTALGVDQIPLRSSNSA